MAGLLLVVMWAKLGVPLVSGLLLFVSVRALYGVLFPRFPKYAIGLSATICLALAAAAVTLFIMGLGAIVDDRSNIAALMSKINEALTLLHDSLPRWISEKVPTSTDSVLRLVQEWISSNAAIFPGLGKKLLTITFQFIIGGFVGVMACIHVLGQRQAGVVVRRPQLVSDLFAHIDRFSVCFENVVFAQFYIATVNAILTGLFLYFGLPLFGYDLPFLEILVSVTFLMGLIPILGNIISNTVICLVALSVSPVASFLALMFLIIIHKLEYFLNAWIIGSRIKVRSYEILGAMLVFEAVFGIWGLVLAPVLYSYIKEEFQQGLPSTEDELPPPP